MALEAECWSFGAELMFWSCPSPSGLLLEEPGAEELVGVVRSMGSPRGDGADIFMGVGVGVVVVIMGTVRAPMVSCAVPFPKIVVEALSVTVAIGSGKEINHISGRVPERAR